MALKVDMPKTDSPVKSKKQTQKDKMSAGLDSLLNTNEDNDDDYAGEVIEEEKPPPWNLIIGGGIIALIAILVTIIIVTRPPPPPPPPLPTPTPTPTPEPTPDPALEALRYLYRIGIGRHYIDEANIFQQGNIESNRFRQDFTRLDQPEIFVHPIRIDRVRDSVTYTKHRAVEDVGIERYFLNAIFRGRNTEIRIPFSIYQVIPPYGVVDVYVEVVTDANGSVTVTYFSVIPPTQIQWR